MAFHLDPAMVTVTWIRKTLLPLLIVVSVVVMAAGLAPGDEDPLCQELRANVTASNIRVLLDSWNYQNLLPPHEGAVWTELHNTTDDHNHDGDSNRGVVRWTQTSNTSCQQSVEICDSSDDRLQGNWLISQLVNRTVNGTPLSQVPISIKYRCLDHCDALFNIHIYEISSPDNNTTDARNISNYQLVREVSSPQHGASNSVDSDQLTIAVNFSTNYSTFYFSIENLATCLILTQVVVFYRVCLYQVQNKIIYPETTTPRGGMIQTIKALCIENAEPRNGSLPILRCSSGGDWSVVSGQCRCRPGAVGPQCILCPVGTYQSSRNNTCSPCPNNSVSNSAGLEQCTCIEGYYRAATGEKDLPCTLPPSPPRNLRVVAKADDSITITWEPPLENPGGRSISYNVYRSLDGGSRVLVANSESASTLTITDLQPGRMYTISVSTVNAITSQIPEADVTASVQAVTTGSTTATVTVQSVSEVSTAAAPSGSTLDASGLIIVAVVVPVSMALIGIFVVALLLFIWAYHKHTAHMKNSQNRLQYKLDRHQSFDNEIPSQQLMKGFSVQSSFKHNLPLNLITPSTNIILDNTIGQGEFGVVYKAYITAKNQIISDTVAIKTLKGFYDREAVRKLLKECSRMYSFNHPNVLSLSGVCLDGGPAPYIIMPLMANGSLLNHLKKNRDSLVISSDNTGSENDCVNARTTSKQLMDMCLQIARGMEYLAKMKMVHRDLAARNCMIDVHYVIKVADFGLAESVGTKEYFRQDKSDVVKLPMKWMAPESFQDYIFTEKTDVWAYGVTCWEIFTGGKVPYPSISIINLPGLLVDGERLQKPMNDACSDEMYALMLQCWQFEAKNRPTFSHLVSSLSQSLEAMADYMEVRETIIPNSNFLVKS